jgi:hypothetical protein
MSKNLKTAVYVGAFVLAIVVIAAFGASAAIPVAGLGFLALVVPPALPARNSGEQQQHFFRVRLGINNVAAMSAGVKIGRLPARAIITAVAVHVNTAFNSVTTDTIVLGSTNGGTDIAASQSLHAAGFAAGTAVGMASTSEVDIWLKYASTGGAASAGDATLILSYIPDNDQ